MHRLRRVPWLSIAAVAAALAAWEATCRAELVNPVLLAPPSRIARTGLTLLGDGALNPDLLFTLEVFAWSVLIAATAGVLTGLLMGLSRTAYQVLNPFITVANSLPKIVLMPLILLWFGIGLSANVFLGALMAAFPIIVSTFTGVRSIDPDLLRLARVYHAPRSLTLRAILLPALTPFILAGLRVGVSYAMVGVLIAEFFASAQGVGYRMVLYMANFQIDAFFVCMTLVAAFTLLCVALVSALERRVERWRPHPPNHA